LALSWCIKAFGISGAFKKIASLLYVGVLHSVGELLHTKCAHVRFNALHLLIGEEMAKHQKNLKPGKITQRFILAKMWQRVNEDWR
jgi:hypothetical protein